MPAHIVDDPIGDPCWSALVRRHPAASVFHSPGWLRALQQTYGFEPFVVTASPGPTLQNGIVACRVKGFVSRRIVSLPFSDHCDPLVAVGDDAAEMLASLADRARSHRGGSLELRPRAVSGSLETAIRSSGLGPAGEYYQHRIDLRRDISELFGRFHHSSTQRAVRRAEREGLAYEAGTSDRLLAAFYRLLRMSRRRHGLPPQPMAWFRNLVTNLGEQLTIHVVSKDGRPIASILTLSFKRTVVYKYGGSDAAFHKLAGMPFLFWQVIQDSHAHGFEELDLGRSDPNQSGLITFKDHLGAERSTLTYYRCPATRHKVARSGWTSLASRRVLARLPDSVLDLAGRLIYRHLG